MKKNLVLSLGGSVICPSEVDIRFLKEFKTLIDSIRKDHNIYVICGGGKTARKYISAGEQFKVSGRDGHNIGIKSTWLNASLISAVIRGRDMSGKPLEQAAKHRGVVVLGGYKEGWTSDMDAAIIAHLVGAKEVVNITNVKGAYDKDPKTHTNAKFLPELSWKHFFAIIHPKYKKAGQHFVFDPIASRYAFNHKLRVIMLDNDMENLKGYLDKQEFVGTIVG